MLRLLHVIHACTCNLMVPGGAGTIVGWIGVAMLLSSLTGLWLWWPLKGSVGADFAGTASRISIRTFTSRQASGSRSRSPCSRSPACGSRFRRCSAVPRGGPPGVGPVALERHQPQCRASPGGGPTAGNRSTSPRSPGRRATRRFDGHNPRGTASRQEVKVANSDAKPSLVPAKPETLARTMRRIHDGTGMPLLWQLVIFLGGNLPAAAGGHGNTDVAADAPAARAESSAKAIRRLAEAKL